MKRLHGKKTLKFHELEPVIKHLEKICVEEPLARYWEMNSRYPKVFEKLIWPPIKIKEGHIYIKERDNYFYTGYISANLNPTEIAESKEERKQLNKLKIEINLKRKV